MISGHLALDLLATLRDRHRAPIECLRCPADLDRWLRAADLGLHAAATDEDLDASRQLRENIYRVVRPLLDGAQPQNADLDKLNQWALRPTLAPQVGPTLERRWAGDVNAALASIARGAVELLATADFDLVRECAAAPACSRIYLDRSPGRRRRWCQMERCGSSAKMRAYRRRRATTT